MIHFVTYLPEDWRLSVFIIEECGEGDDIIETLADMGCRGSELADASGEIHRCGMNIGITYSVGSRRNSVLVVGLQDSISELINTMRHEQHHVISHICTEDRVDMDSEEAAYIAGDVGQAVYEGLVKCGVL